MTPHEHKIFIEQIRILYQRAPSVIPINIFVGGILAVILLPVAPDYQVLAWWGSLFALCVLRYFHVRYLVARKDWQERAHVYRDYFTAATFLTSLVWLSVFFIFAFSVPDVYLLFILFAMGGMSVGAVASMATSPRSFFAYTVPIVLVPGCIFLAEGDTLGLAMAGVIFIYFLSITSTFMQSYKLVTRSIALGLEKDDLIRDLKISNQHLEVANQKIVALSHTDELTQLSNRRHLDMTLQKEWSRAVRSSLPICFIMLDIDYFKNYNDKFGHQQGDECLQKVSAELRSLIKRPGDFVARYGGEEFAIILPDTDCEGAVQLMKELKDNIQNLHLPTANTSVSAFVTISIGVACIRPKPEDDLSSLVSAADQQLYAAKRAGRNAIKQISLSE